MLALNNISLRGGRKILVENASFPGPRTDYTLDVATHPGGYCLDDGHEPNDSSGSNTTSPNEMVRMCQ